MKIKNIHSCFLIFIAITVLFSLIACSPVEYENIEKEAVEIAEDDSAIDKAANDGRSITISFHPVKGARSYAVSIDGYSETPEAIEPVLNGGIYTATIELTALKTRSLSSTIEGTLYASSSLDVSDAEDWSAVTTFSAEYERTSIDSYAPDVRLDERRKDSAIIEIQNAPESGMEYKIAFQDGNEQIFRTESITLSGLGEKDTYSIVVSHRYSGTEEWGTKTTSLTIGAFEGAKELAISADSTSGDITITKISCGFTRLELVKDSTGRVVTAVELDGSTSSYTFKAEDAFPVFDIGVFKAKAISADTTVISDSIPYASPIMNGKETKGRQHYKITFPVAEDVSAKLAEENTDKKFSISGSKATIELSGLESLTEYNTSITLSSDNNSIISVPLSFRTASFAGYYEFYDPNPGKNEMDKFSVVVKENPNASSDKCKYYVYSNEGSIQYRIMPLVDAAVDKDVPAEILYKGDNDYQKAYRWNNEKWNSLANIISPTKWSVDSFDISSPDCFKTLITSFAGLSTTTTTIFTFEEDASMTPSIIFFNKITDKLGSNFNSALMKNGMWEEQGFTEEDGPYTFRLSYKGALTK